MTMMKPLLDKSWLQRLAEVSLDSIGNATSANWLGLIACHMNFKYIVIGCKPNIFVAAACILCSNRNDCPCG
jgi:hypothetical protein